MNYMKKVFTAGLLLLLYAAAYAEVKLPHVFSDNMVLQQNSSVALWGTAREGARVSISPSWARTRTVVTADADGKWETRIQTPGAGGPYEIVLSDGEKLKLSNIMIGEVWFCSGQSNMEMPMRGYSSQPVEGSMDIILGANPRTPIRVCTVSKAKSDKEEEDCACRWLENRPEVVSATSATAYFFAKQLYETLGVPVGIIVSKWGGTRIESWMQGGELFNAMVAPLIPYTIKGWIWYQGESNRDNADHYASLMESYARMMRERWTAPDMPFYYAQIAPYIYEGENGTSACMIQEAQEKALDLIPHSGMAVTVDIGDRDCIHPARKKDVGQRLAALALCHDYGLKGFVADAPRYKSMSVGEGVINVQFTDYGHGMAPLGHDITGFEVAGEDMVFYPAAAKVASDRKSVDVDIPSEVKSPKAICYAFRNVPGRVNLISAWGIPVGPFRADVIEGCL